MNPQNSSAEHVGPVPLRGAERKPMTLRCEARIGVGPWSTVILQNLSTDGFQMARTPGLRPETQLRIRLPKLELLPAVVRWVDKEHAGCAFARPLSAYVLDHIAHHAINRWG
jgi:hypothetical protein